jgi:hypothetical protein
MYFLSEQDIRELDRVYVSRAPTGFDFDRGRVQTRFRAHIRNQGDEDERYDQMKLAMG